MKLQLLFLILFFTAQITAADMMQLADFQDRINLHNIEVKQARLRLKQAQAQARTQWRTLLPSLDASIERSHSDQEGTRRLTSGLNLDDNDVSGLAIEPVDAYRARLILNQTIFDNTDWYELKLRWTEIKKRKIELKQLEEKKHLELYDVFTQYLSSQENVTVLAEQLEIIQTHLAETKEKTIHKITTQQDVYALETEREKIKSELAKNKILIQLSELKMRSISGIEKDQVITILSPSEAVRRTDYALTQFERYCTQAIQNRLEFKRIDLEKKTVKIQYSAIKNGYWPKIALSSSYGYTDDDSYSFDANDSDYSVQLAAQFKIFDGFSSFSKMKELKLKQEELDLAKELQAYTVKDEVLDALTEYQTAQSNYEVSAQDVQFKTEVLAHITEAARLSQKTTLDLAYAQLDVIKAAAEKMKSSHEINRAAAAIKVAMGIDIYIKER